MCSAQKQNQLSNQCPTDARVLKMEVTWNDVSNKISLEMYFICNKAMQANLIDDGDEVSHAKR